MSLNFPSHPPQLDDEVMYVRSQFAADAPFLALLNARHIAGTRTKVLVKDLSVNSQVVAPGASTLLAQWLVRYSLEIDRVVAQPWFIIAPPLEAVSLGWYITTQTTAGADLATGATITPPNDGIWRAPPSRPVQGRYGRGLMDHDAHPNYVAGTVWDYQTWSTWGPPCTVVPTVTGSREQILSLYATDTGLLPLDEDRGPYLAGILAWEEVDRA